jgi:hypothetical protein
MGEVNIIQNQKFEIDVVELRETVAIARPLILEGSTRRSLKGSEGRAMAYPRTNILGLVQRH